MDLISRQAAIDVKERWMDGCGYCDYRMEHREDDEVIITCGHPERTLYKEGQIPKWAAKDCRIAHCPKSEKEGGYETD